MLQSLSSLDTAAAAEMSEEVKCAICLERVSPGQEPDRNVANPYKCSHTCFHADCIRRWNNEAATCPMCRAPSTGVTPSPHLPKRILIWHETQRIPARCYIADKVVSPEEIDTVPIIVIESNEWLNQNVAAGDIIYHHA